MAKFVDPQYVKQHLADTKVVNVLSKGSYDRQHIPGTLNAPVEGDGFDETIQRLAPNKHDPIVVHCSDNECQASTKAAKRLEQMGYKQVYDFKSGIQGWKESGGQFESGEQVKSSEQAVSSGDAESSGQRARPERPGAGRTRIRATEEKPPRAT